MRQAFVARVLCVLLIGSSLGLPGPAAADAAAQMGKPPEVTAIECSVPLEGPCVTAPDTPADYYSRVDYGWIPKPKSAEDSFLLRESLQIPPLLQEACTEPSDAENGGEGFLTDVVSKASLLRLVERQGGLDALRRAFTGTPPIKDPSGTYRRCLDRYADGWDDGTPNTTAGWQRVIDLVKRVPALFGTPGTDGLENCRDVDTGKDWDITMALTFRVWGLLHDDDKEKLKNDIAVRAWLQGRTDDIEEVVCHVLFLDIDVPETENHRFLIRTTKLLHNEWLPMLDLNQHPSRGPAVDDYIRDSNPNNETNGVAGWVRAHLQATLDRDWREYNSRPYSRWQLVGLLNLHDFAKDPGIRDLARRALEFQAVKHVSQSADNLRTVPFRRNKENDNRVLFQGRTTAPMFQVWMGGLAQPAYPSAYGEEPGAKGGVVGEMALAASSTYRPSTWLADIAFNRSKRDHLQFFNGQGQKEAGYTGPDFTISGGGFETQCPYPYYAVVEICYGSGNDPGTIEPVVLMPRLERIPPDNTTAFPDVDRFIHIDTRKGQDCVARNFACGPIVKIPEGIAPGAGCVAESSHETPAYDLTDKALRFDESCAGGAYRGHCFFAYAARASFHVQIGTNPPDAPISYLVTHSCDPNTGDADRQFQAFVTYMRTTGRPRGNASLCTGSLHESGSQVLMTLTVPPTFGDLTGVTSGEEVSAIAETCGIGRPYSHYVVQPGTRFLRPHGVMTGDIGLYGSLRFPLSVATLSASMGQSVFEQAVRFTATVSTNPPRQLGGTVRFLDGTTLIGIAQLTDAGNGTAKAELTTPALRVGTHHIVASYLGDAVATASIAEMTHTVKKAPTTLAYTGATTGDYHDPATVSARLTNTVTGGPRPGAPVAFTLNGQETCTGLTDTDGVARCVITPNEPAGTYPIAARYAGDDNFLPSQVQRDFIVTKEQTTLAYTGDTHIANGTPARLAAVLKEEGVVPIQGRLVSFTLGTGATRQQCTGTTDEAGTARCEFVVTGQPLNDAATVPVTATFDGDPYYLPSSDSATLKLQYATGRATGLAAQIRLPLIPVGLAPTPDTGPVRTADATSTTTPCTANVSALVVTAHALCVNVTTALNPGTSTATTTAADTRIGLPGMPVVELSGIRATSTSTCAAATGTVALTVTVAGQPITVPTGPNAAIDLGGGLRLVVNEQTTVNGADQGLTATAAHLTAAGGTVDIIVGTSTSAMHNCKP